MIYKTFMDPLRASQRLSAAPQHAVLTVIKTDYFDRIFKVYALASKKLGKFIRIRLENPSFTPSYT